MAKKKVTTPEEEGVESKSQDPTIPTSTSSEDTPEVEDETTKPAEAEQEAEETDEAVPSTDEEPEPKPTSTTPDSEEATPSEQSGGKPAEVEQEAEATDEAIPSTDEEPEPKPTSTTPGSEEATPSEQSRGGKPAEEGGDPDATEKPAEGADTSGDTPEDGDTEGGAAQDEENREEYEDAAPSALSDIAHQVLRDYDLKVVFLTTDGTAFYGYSDALNYARTLADETVHHFFRTPPTDDELRQLLPRDLLPEHLLKKEE